MGNEQSGNSQRGGAGSRGSPRSPLSPTAAAAASASLARQYEQLSLGGGRHESVASDGDSEVPYVSYTVNKPIGGDSPKRKQGRGATGARAKAKSSFRFKDSTSHNTMVTVSSGNNDGQTQTDPEVERLSQIPSFLPIMRASLSGSAAKDPDILERLDYRGLLSMAERYQTYLGKNAAVISANQAELTRNIKEVDQTVARVTQGLADRQKALAQHQQKFKQVDEMSKCLARCQLLLNENIEQMEVLNSMLPVEDRLEPFVWTTG